MVTNNSTDCPYKGLRPYTEGDRRYFFGRERDKEVIASNLYVAPLTILYGASGVGKSSVIQAGAIPQLRGGKRVAVVYFNEWQGDYFERALKEQTLKEVCRSTGKAPEEVLSRVKEFLEQEDGARGHSPARGNGSPKGVESVTLDDLLLGCTKGLGLHVLLVFDQFEEYFLYHTPGTSAEGFDAEFARAVNQQEAGVNFMLSMREEELSKLDRFRQRIPNLLSNLVRLENLDRDSARSAIVEPVEVYNAEPEHADEKVTIGPGLVEEILRQVDPDTAEAEVTGQPSPTHTGGRKARIETPFLQLVLTRLWEEERGLGSNMLRLETLNRLGGAKNIASKHLDEVMDKLGNDERETAAAVLRFLVTPTGSKIAQQPTSLASWADVTPEHVRKVLGDLSSKQDMCILRKLSLPNQEERYELFHDVLGPAILAWRDRYVNGRRLARQREEAESRIRAEQRRARRLYMFLIGAVLLLLMMGGLTVFAIQQQRAATWQKGEAERQKGEAEGQAVIAVHARTEAEKASSDLADQKKKVEGALEIAKTQKNEAIAAKDLADKQRKRADDLNTSVEQSTMIDRTRGAALSALKAGNFEEAISKNRELVGLAADNRSVRVEALLSIADNQLNGSQTGPYLFLFMLQPELKGIEKDASEATQTVLQYLPYLLLAAQGESPESDDKALIANMKKTSDEIAKTLDEASKTNQGGGEVDRLRDEAEIETRRGSLAYLSALISDGADESKSDNLSPTQLEEILAHYEKASEAYRKAGERGQEAKTLRKMGLLLEESAADTEKSPAAVDGEGDNGGEHESELARKRAVVERIVNYFDRAARSYNAAGKRLDEATMYSHLGDFCAELTTDYKNKEDVAQTYYQTALAVYVEINRPDKEADVAKTLADLLKKNGGSAVEFYKQARRAYSRAAARSHGKDSSLNNKENEMLKAVADLLPDSGPNSKEAYFRKEVIASYAADPAAQARALGMVAGYYKGSDKAKALEYYKEERQAWKRAGNLKEEGDVLYDMGNLSKEKGEQNYTEWFEQARKVYDGIDARAKDEGGDLILPTVAYNLKAIADLYDKDDKEDLAVAAYADALRAYTTSQSRDSYTLKSFIQPLAKFYVKRDDPKAKQVAQTALDYFRAKQDLMGEASMLETFGSVYKEQGKGQDAVGYYEEAAKVYEKMKKFYETSGMVTAVGKILEEQGEKGKALVDYYNRVADESHRLNNHFREGAAYWAAANYYHEAKQNQEAIRYYGLTRQACHDAGLKTEEASVLRSISYIYLELGDKPSADAAVKQADALTNKEN